MNSLSQALLLAAKEIKNPEKNATNPFLKNKYADLGNVIDVCKDTLLKYGVLMLQGSRLTPHPGWVEVYTTFIHADSGESLQNTVVLQAKEAGPQASAGLITYGRRYSLMGALGLYADDDDDGNTATGLVVQGGFGARPKGK